MQVGPKPWKTLKLELVDVHRSLNCPMYRDCTNEASNANWESFTCAFCPLGKGKWNRTYDEGTFTREGGDHEYPKRTANSISAT
jgi:hypothetical protein